MSFVLSGAVWTTYIALDICKTNSHCSDKWLNTGEPTLQDRLWLSIYFRNLNINVHVFAREDGWFEKGVKEAILVKLEKHSLNRQKSYNTSCQRPTIPPQQVP